MHDYLKWLILVKNRGFFTSGAFIPVLFLPLFLSFALLAAGITIFFYIVVGCEIAIFALPTYFFLEDVWLMSKEEYKKSRQEFKDTRDK